MSTHAQYAFDIAQKFDGSNASSLGVAPKLAYAAIRFITAEAALLKALEADSSFVLSEDQKQRLALLQRWAPEDQK